MQPYKSRYWRNADPKDGAAFGQQVVTVCACYPAAPARRKAEGIHTVGVDEETGIQAPERIAPTKPMRPEREEEPEFEYTRHGGRTWIGNFEVATGRVIAPTVQETRDEADFARHIEQTVATDPAAAWLFVADHRTTHGSEPLALLGAGPCGLPADTLGHKGKNGVLQSVATQKAFLMEASHRVRFVYVPKHTSWLNQVGIGFRVLVRKVIRRGRFRSTEDLRDRILEFIDYVNRTMAKPYKWTYAGRPLNV